MATRHKKEVNLLYDGNQVDVDYEAKVLQEVSGYCEERSDEAGNVIFLRVTNTMSVLY